MLLLDIDLEHSFTFVHFVEEENKVNYRKYVDVPYSFVHESGKVEDKVLKVYAKRKGVVNTLNKLEPILIEKGAMKKIEINNSVFRLIHLDLAYNVISENIKIDGGKSLHAFEMNSFIKSTIKSILRK